MRVVADAHAIFWHLQRSSKLSEPAAEALRDARASDGITVSIATLVDLWYVTQTTQAITADDLARVRAALDASAHSSSFACEPGRRPSADAHSLACRRSSNSRYG